ncbi:MAG: C40 family peptidase [Actinomycetota bacterium]
MSNNVSGRHRAPIRLNPALSLSSAISRSAKPAAKASAVFAVSGGMVASFALPASAATYTPLVKPTAPAATVVLPTAAPTAAQAPLVSPSFGDIGFSGVAKPKPKPAPAPVAASRATITSSRSAARTPVASTAPVPAPRSAGVIGIAASLAGIPYVYGGTTTSGFDCSGYTQYVFGQFGISLPRTAEEQRQAATPVSTPAVGDLVFFGSPAYHVGIYAGNGMMWDSPHSGTSVQLRSIFGSATYGRV